MAQYMDHAWTRAEGAERKKTKAVDVEHKTPDIPCKALSMTYHRM